MHYFWGSELSQWFPCRFTEKGKEKVKKDFGEGKTI